MRHKYVQRLRFKDGSAVVSLMAHVGCITRGKAIERVENYRAAFDLNQSTTQLVSGPIKRPLCCVGCGEWLQGGDTVALWLGFNRPAPIISDQWKQTL